MLKYDLFFSNIVNPTFQVKWYTNCISNLSYGKIFHDI